MPVELQLQNIRVVDVERFAVAEDSDDNSQTNGGFGSRNGHYNKDEKLSGDVPEVTGKGDKRQIHGVEHQLNTHEHRNNIPFDDYARHAYRKKNGGQRQIPGKLRPICKHFKVAYPST